jgi:nicotinamidase-related amidase
MSQPKTLLEMAGADMTPNALSDSALVLIDYQMEYVTGGAFDLDGEGGQIAPQVAQADGEAIVRKSLPIAFAGTTLHDDLQELGAKNLIFVGFMTHMCVSASVRAALDLGYRSTLVSSAAATRDLPTPSGGIIDAASLHGASVAALGDRFAIIVERADQLPE